MTGRLHQIMEWPGQTAGAGAPVTLLSALLEGPASPRPGADPGR